VSIATAYAETSLQAELQRVDTLLAERDLHEFVRQAWHVIDPGHPFVDNWHIRLLCSKLQAVTRREIKRLIINVPPRSGKSSVVCALWPVWTWLQDPTHQWLTISHSGTFATRDALKSRRLLQSPWFQQRWGHLFKLTGDQNQKTRYENDKRGYRIALGITAGITGEGGDTILLDDPMDRDAAHSELERERANVTYDEAISTRLNDPATGAIVVIMQRLHEADTTGHLLDGEEAWEHVCLPMLYEPDHPHVCADDERTEADELLWPDRFTPEVVAAAKGKGSYFFAGQYQQLPSPVGGGIWREEYFKDAKTMRRTGRPHIFNVADLAYSSKQTADYTVIMTFSGDTATGELEIVNVMRARADLIDATEAGSHRWLLRDARVRWHSEYTLVENAGLASRVIEFAKRDGEPVEGLEADRDKVARAHAGMIVGEMGNLFVDKTAPWWPTLWHELASFPNGAHDDQADCLAYGCIHWRDIITGKRDGDVGALGYGMADQYM
jgi:predicted phage terminase large subunit-like protein